MTTYLVTGGAGFIGSHIMRRLVEKRKQDPSINIRVLDSLATGFMYNVQPFIDSGDITFLKADLNDENVVPVAVEGVDVIFHEAALASVPLSIEQPLTVHQACVSGTVHLLDCARKAGVQRVVYAASSSAYGDSPTPRKLETECPGPISPYGAAKLAAELYLQAFAASYNIETVRLRYFNVFGPRQDPKSPYSAVIPLFITAMLNGRQPTIFGDGLQSRDFTFVSNIVDANMLAAEAPAEDVSGKVFNIANGMSINLLMLVDTINEILGTHIKPIHAAPRVGDIRESVADISQARKFLKFEPRVDLLEGLTKTVEFYRESPL